MAKKATEQDENTKDKESISTKSSKLKAVSHYLNNRSHYYIFFIALFGVVLIFFGLKYDNNAEVDPNTSPQKYVGAIIEQANKLENEGKYHESVELLEDATQHLNEESGPNAHIVYSKLGFNKHLLEDHQGSNEAYTRALGYFAQYESFVESDNYAPVTLVYEAAHAAEHADATTSAYMLYRQVASRIDEWPEEDRARIEEEVAEKVREVTEDLAEESKENPPLDSSIRRITF